MSFREHHRPRAAESGEAPVVAMDAAPVAESGDARSMEAPHDAQPDRFTRRIECAEPSEKPAPPRVARGRRSRSV